MDSTEVTPKEERKGNNALIENNICVEQISEEFKCPLCLCVLKDAQHLITCQHLFCKYCITNYFESEPKPLHCPVDRISATLANVVPAPLVVTNIIQQFQVKCCNYANGCTARMPLSQLDDHDMECSFSRRASMLGAMGQTQVEADASIPMKIHLKMADSGKTIVIDIDETADVLTLKQRINQIEGIVRAEGLLSS